MKKPSNYWTQETCLNDASNYLTIKDWRNNSSGYAAAKRIKCLELCTKHMKKLGSHYKRMIYSFEFSDMSVYVGLTYDLEKRKLNHLTNKESQVYKHIVKTKLLPKLIPHTDFICCETASIKEGEILKNYENKGWNILNVAKTGALGGGRLFWTLEKCFKNAQNFKSKKEWEKNSHGAYHSSKRNGWFETCTSHMKRPPSKKLIWNRDKCAQEAKKYDTRIKWKRNSYPSYSAAVRHKILDFCCVHMIKSKS